MGVDRACSASGAAHILVDCRGEALRGGLEAERGAGLERVVLHRALQEWVTKVHRVASDGPPRGERSVHLHAKPVSSIAREDSREGEEEVGFFSSRINRVGSS